MDGPARHCDMSHDLPVMYKGLPLTSNDSMDCLWLCSSLISKSVNLHMFLSLHACMHLGRPQTHLFLMTRLRSASSLVSL